MEAQTSKPLRWEWWCLALAVAVGAALRFWQAATAPGLWYDEAINGLDALRILREPGWPMFFDTNGHVREPLFMYMEAAGVALGGTTAFAIRAVAAVVGTATLPVVWLVAREYRGPVFAALVLWVFTLMRWHIHFSGLAFRTILAPLVASLVALFFLRMWRRNSMADAVWCGAFLGVGAYTYLAFRLMPLVMLAPMVVAGWRASRDPAFGRNRVGRLCGVLVGAAALVFLPLAIHFLRVPEHFTGRSDEVTFFARGNAASLLARQCRDVALMALIRGDHVGKHNLPGYPAFWQSTRIDPDGVAAAWEAERAAAQAEGRPPRDPHGTGVPALPLPAGLLFYVGFGLMAAGARRHPGDAFFVALLVVGSLASVLSFGAPNMLRLLMLTPAVAIAVARGLEAVGSLFAPAAPQDFESPADVERRIALGQRVRLGVLAALIFVGAAQDLALQTRWATHPMVPVEFNTDMASLGSYLAAQPDRLPVRLPFDAPHPTLAYLADGYQWNPPVTDLGAAWWELRGEYFAPLEPAGGRALGTGRFLPIVHASGLQLGALVEITR